MAKIFGIIDERYPDVFLYSDHKDGDRKDLEIEGEQEVIKRIEQIAQDYDNIRKALTNNHSTEKVEIPGIGEIRIK